MQSLGYRADTGDAILRRRLSRRRVTAGPGVNYNGMLHAYNDLAFVGCCAEVAKCIAHIVFCEVKLRIDDRLERAGFEELIKVGEVAIGLQCYHPKRLVSRTARA